MVPVDWTPTTGLFSLKAGDPTDTFAPYDQAVYKYDKLACPLYPIHPAVGVHTGAQAVRSGVPTEGTAGGAPREAG